MAHVVPKEVSAKLVLIQDGKVLIRTFVDPKTGKIIYDLPGGRVDVGEQPIEAAKREALEEIGAKVTDLRLIHAEFVGSQNNPTLGIFYASDKFIIDAKPQEGKDAVDGEIERLNIEDALLRLSFDVCVRAVSMASTILKTTLK